MTFSFKINLYHLTLSQNFEKSTDNFRLGSKYLLCNIEEEQNSYQYVLTRKHIPVARDMDSFVIYITVFPVHVMVLLSQVSFPLLDTLICYFIA